MHFIFDLDETVIDSSHRQGETLDGLDSLEHSGQYPKRYAFTSGRPDESGLSQRGRCDGLH